MASTTKTFNSSDKVSTQTELYEAIPLTGSLFFGTYDEPDPGNEATTNIKTYSHEMFQTVYDYPHASSSANQLFDITVGLASDSGNYLTASVSTTAGVQEAAAIKLNMYNYFAQILSGYDVNNQLQQFDKDGNLAAAGDKHKDVFFLAFSRVLKKDSVQKGSFEIQVGTGSWGTPFDISPGDGGATRVIRDGPTPNQNYFVNSPAGEYSTLYYNDGDSDILVGLVYYDAGIAVISKEAFYDSGSPIQFDANNNDIDYVMREGSVDDFANALRKRIKNIRLNNVTEVNSMIYHCRVQSGDFNYSNNPTYLQDSKIVVKVNASDDPISYITGVGLYSEDGELLAVAKLSTPIKNTPDTDFTIKVRLDY